MTIFIDGLQLFVLVAPRLWRSLKCDGVYLYAWEPRSSRKLVSGAAWPSSIISGLTRPMADHFPAWFIETKSNLRRRHGELLTLTRKCSSQWGVGQGDRA